MTYVTPTAYSKIVTFPVALAQTELRRGKALQIATFSVAVGQRLQMKSLHLQVYRVLNPGLLPDLLNSIGAVSVGLYQASMLTGALALISRNASGVSSYNPFKSCEIYSPGEYKIIVSNNTRNIDYSVIVTGAVKLFI